MVKLIAHRGNIDGPDSWNENRPSHIQKALDLGFDVEVDVWYNVGNGTTWATPFEESKIFLGHDTGEYETDIHFLKDPRVWCHAKNMDAFIGLYTAGANVFWTDSDGITITSTGVIWTDVAYGRLLDTFEERLVLVDLDGSHTRRMRRSYKTLPKYRICSDYVGRIKELYECDK